METALSFPKRQQRLCPVKTQNSESQRTYFLRKNYIKRHENFWVCKRLAEQDFCKFFADGMIPFYAISIFVNKFATFFFTLSVNGDGA